MTNLRDGVMARELRLPQTLNAELKRYTLSLQEAGKRQSDGSRISENWVILEAVREYLRKHPSPQGKAHEQKKRS